MSIDEDKMQTVLHISVIDEATLRLSYGREEKSISAPSFTSTSSLRWLLEDYATKHPYDTSRSQDSVQYLKRFGLSVTEAIHKASVLPAALDGHLPVRVTTSPGSPIHRLPWEAHADPVYWSLANPEWKFATVSVERCLPHPHAPFALQVTDQLNILLISARPDGAADIRGNLVTFPLAKIVSVYPGLQGKCVNLDVVRPGTWSAFGSALRSKPVGYYHLVHLDVHGDEASGSVYFLKLLRRRTKAEGVPYAAVAMLLAKHEVSFVVVNACESSGLAEEALKKGVQGALAMKYKALDSTIELFMGFFYLYFLIYRRSFATAARDAVDRLRKDQRRNAALARDVEVPDYVVPVTYRAGNADLRLKEDEKSLEENLGFLDEVMRFVDPIEMVGRDRELMMMESAVSMCPIVLVHGVGGVGKSIFLKHLAWYWEATGMVEETVIIRDIKGPEDLEAAWKQSAHIKGKRLIILEDIQHVKLETSEQVKLRRYLEELVEQGPGCYVLLASRKQQALGWNCGEDILSFELSGLNLMHSLELSRRVVRNVRPGTYYSDRESITYLEHVIDLLQGNPLAIKLVFWNIGNYDIPPKEAFELLLTGSFKLREAVEFCGDGAGFSNDTQVFVYSWSRSLASLNTKEIGFGLPVLLAPFNVVVLRDLRAYHYLNLCQWASGKLPGLQVVSQREEIVYDLHRYKEEHVKAASYAQLVEGLLELGALWPAEPTGLLKEEPQPEAYKVHPVFTLCVREMAETVSELWGSAKRAFVQHRVWFERHVTRIVMRSFPRYQWDECTMKTLKLTGRWNLVAAVIHSHNEPDKMKEIQEQGMPLTALLLIGISTNLGKVPEISIAMLSYLAKELNRLKSFDPQRNPDPAMSRMVLYSMLKIVQCLRHGLTGTTAPEFFRVLDVADEYLSNGGILNGPTEVTMMELRTAQAEFIVEADPKRSLELVERNLRHEPFSRDDPQFFPPIKRNIFRDLMFWFGNAHAVETNSSLGTASPGGRKLADIVPNTKTEAHLTNSNFEKFFSANIGSVFKPSSNSARTIATFSPTAREIFKGSFGSLYSDLDLSSSSTDAYFRNILRSDSTRKLTAYMEGTAHLYDGDLERANSILHEALDRQLASSNEFVHNVIVQQKLSEVALKQEKWATALEHLSAMRAELKEDQIVPGLWSKTAFCHDRLGHTEEVKHSAIQALKVATQLPEEVREEETFTCCLLVAGLKAVKEFKCTTGQADEYLNPIALLDYALSIAYSERNKRLYPRDGVLYDYLQTRVSAFCERYLWKGKQKVTDSAHREFIARISPDLNEVIAMAFQAREELAKLGWEMGARREVEAVLYANELPQLDWMKESKWAEKTLDQRFPEERRKQRLWEHELAAEFERAFA